LKNLDAHDPVNPKYILQNHLGRTAIYSAKSWFRDCFISHGNISDGENIEWYDEHLDNAGKLYHCHPSVPEHAILPS